MQLSSQTLSLSEKLNLLADAAKYDVACTSSGVNRAGKQGHLGNSVSCGICHSFSSDGRCISLLKILQSNDCIYDCKYCVNRAGNDRQRATFTPEEVCTLVTEFYRRNYIEGLFLSSAVCKNPAHTMELMYRTLHLLRNRYRFNGYIHVKAIPGAPVELIEKTGYLADRMSVNLELPTGEGLQKLAPQKTQKAILKPMRQIQSGIVDYRLTAGKSAFLERSSGNRYLSHSIFDTRKQISASAADLGWISSSSARSLPEKERSAPFVPAGQSTQMIIGATKENDYQLLSTSQLLYQQYDLKRVFTPPTFRSTRIPPCPHVKPSRRFFGNTAFIRQTGCSASTVFRRMNCSMKPTRTFMHSSTRNATGRCAIWSCFRWRSTRLSMPTFCAFPASGRNRPCGL